MWRNKNINWSTLSLSLSLYVYIYIFFFKVSDRQLACRYIVILCCWGFSRGEVKNFCLERSSCGINIYQDNSHTYIYTHAFLLHINIYIHTLFYLISYIYAHTQPKRKNLIFSIIIMFDDDLS